MFAGPMGNGVTTHTMVGVDSVVSLGSAVCLVLDPRGTTVYVRGREWWSWATGDDVGRRAAAVGLLRADVASRGDIAAAFGVSTVTLWRWSTAAAEQGVAGLRSARPGPKGAWKLTDDVVDRIATLDRAGLSQREIARRVGVSSYSVRQVQRSSTASDDTSPVHPDEPASPAARLDGGAARSRPGLRVPTGQRLPLAGLLLAVPAIHATGLVQAAADVARAHGRYSLDTEDADAALVRLALLALVGRSDARRDVRNDLADVGRLVGRDAPWELSAVAQDLADLRERVPVGELMAALAGHQPGGCPDAIGVLSVGGTARAVCIDRGRDAVSFDVWSSVGVSLCTTVGGAVFVVSSTPTQHAVDEVRRSISDVRAAAGGHRVTVLFERPGWPAGLFADLLDEDVEVMCPDPDRRRGRTRPSRCDGTDVDDPMAADRDDASSAAAGDATSDGLCDVTVLVPLAEHDARRLGRTALTLRRVTHRQEDAGRQTAVLTSRTDIPADVVVSCLADPWCHAAYAQVSEAFGARDVLDAATDHTAHRMVANPALADAREEVRRLTTVLADGQAAIERNRHLPDLAGMVAELEVALDQVRAQLEVTEQRVATLPPYVADIDPPTAARRLDSDTELVAHTIRSAAFAAVTTLARSLVSRLEPGTDEGRTVGDRMGAPRTDRSHVQGGGTGDVLAPVRDVLRSPGVVDVTSGELRVTLDAPRDPARARAVAGLCDDLNVTATTYPGTNLVLRFALGPRVMSERRLGQA